MNLDIDRNRLVFAVHVLVGGGFAAFGVLLLAEGATIPGAVRLAIGLVVIAVGRSLVKTL